MSFYDVYHLHSLQPPSRRKSARLLLVGRTSNFRDPRTCAGWPLKVCAWVLLATLLLAPGEGRGEGGGERPGEVKRGEGEEGTPSDGVLPAGWEDRDRTTGPTGTRNLILGLDYNLEVWEMRIFMASLRAAGCGADVVIFIGGDITAEKALLAERHGIKFVPYDAESLVRSHGPAGVHRFHLYRRFLDERRHDYSLVLHTDVRDVLFQLDPFEEIEAYGGGVFFLEGEDRVIGESWTNRMWMTRNCSVYHAEGVLSQVGHNLRSCSGNIFGTAEAVHTYSKMMEEEQARTVVDGMWCADQAVHQALLWQGKFGAALKNLTMYNNHDGPLGTVGDVYDAHLNAENDLCNGNFKPYAVVHQYDRLKFMLSIANARYADENGGEEDAEMADPAFTDGIYPRPHVTESARSWHSQRRARIASEHHQRVVDCLGGVAPVLSVQGPHAEEGEIAGPRASEEQWLHVQAIQKIVSHPPPFPPWMYHHAGIVMSAGSAMEIAEACVSISALRNRGCALPVEIFYTGKSKMVANRVQERLKSLSPETVLIDMLRMPGMDSNMELDGRQMQAFAILHSSFVEVVWMDRRIHPMHDVRGVFDDESYLEHGSLFWQDLVTDPHRLKLSWSEQYVIEMGIEDMGMAEREFEAGMLVVDKERCWVALQVVVYMSREYAHFDHFDGMTNVDSWRLAFKMLGARHGLVSHLPDLVGRLDEIGRFCGNNLLYKSTDGKPVFLRKIVQQSLAADIPTPCDETNATCIQTTWAAARAASEWEVETVHDDDAQKFYALRLHDDSQNESSFSLPHVQPGWRILGKPEVKVGWCIANGINNTVNTFPVRPVDVSLSQVEQDALDGIWS